MNIFRNKFILYLLLIIISFTSFSYIISDWKYNTFRLNWPIDLAFFNHVFWNFVHGNMFLTLTSCGANGPYIFRQVHFSVVRFLFVPFYKFFPSVHTLFLLQCFIISLGVIPVYLIGKYKTKSRSFGLLCALFYVLMPGVLNLSHNDFRTLQICAPFLFFAFYFYDQRRWKGFLVSALFALSVREEMVVPIALLSILSLFRKEGIKQKLMWLCYPIILSLLWFVLYSLYRKYIYNDGINSLHDFLNAGGLLMNFISRIYSQLPYMINCMKDAFMYFLNTFSIIFILSFFRPLPLLIGFPAFLYFSTLHEEFSPGSNYPDQHYTAIIASFIIIAFILSISKIHIILKRYSVNAGTAKLKLVFKVINKFIICGILFVLITTSWQNLLSILEIGSRYILKEQILLHRFKCNIRDEDVIMTSRNLSPYFSSRERVYCYEELGPFYSWGVLEETDYVVVEREHKESIDRIRRSGKFNIFDETENLIFYARSR